MASKGSAAFCLEALVPGQCVNGSRGRARELWRAGPPFCSRGLQGWRQLSPRCAAVSSVLVLSQERLLGDVNRAIAARGLGTSRPVSPSFAGSPSGRDGATVSAPVEYRLISL